MNKQFLLAAMIVLLSQYAVAQTKADTIAARYNWLGVDMKYHGKGIHTLHRLSEIVRGDHAAYPALRKAKHIRAASLTVSAAGVAVLIGYGAIVASSTASFRPAVPLIAAGSVVAICVPLSVCFYKNEWKAVKMYNGDINKMSCNGIKAEYYFTFSGTSLGFGMRF